MNNTIIIDYDLNKKKKLITPEDLLPKTVENTRGDLMPFDANKVIDSLIKETGLDRKQAIIVTRNVLRRISTLGLEFIAAPHLRELVCGELTAEKLHVFRNHYTRLGIPIYDVKKMLEGKMEDEHGIMNPAMTYMWIANQVMEQYVHLDQISQSARELHLKGIINIDLLRFWDQPINVQWDLRTIFLHGVPPINWVGVAKSKPAQNALTAVSHGAKWLGLAQNEFCGGQGYDNFTVFIAPYLRGMLYKSNRPNEVDIRQVAQSFVFETNQMFGSYLGPIMDTYITCTPYVPEELWDVDAVGPGGKIVGKYKDFEPECRQFFKALVEVYSEGDAEGKPIRIPKHQIKINQRGISEFEADYLYVLEKETLIKGPTYFINNITNSNLAEIHGQTFCIKLKADPQYQVHQTVDLTKYNYQSGLNNFSLLQNVNINLPRLAYLIKKQNNSIFDQLNAILPNIEHVLLKKYTMIKNEIEADISKLPFCKGILPATHLKPQALLDLAKQCVSISITGLYECIQAILGVTLKDQKGYELGLQIIEYIQKFAKEATQRNGIAFIVVDKAVENSERRFASLDIKYEPEYAYEFVQEVLNGSKNFAYTPNIMIPYEKDATQTLKNLEIQGKFQALLCAANFIPIPKAIRGSDLKANWEFLKNLFQKTAIHCIYFE